RDGSALATQRRRIGLSSEPAETKTQPAMHPAKGPTNVTCSGRAVARAQPTDGRAATTQRPCCIQQKDAALPPQRPCNDSQDILRASYRKLTSYPTGDSRHFRTASST